MKKSYSLICMSFEGDYIVERPEFDTIEKAWKHSEDIGSRWFFYPFHFVVTSSLKTIADSFDGFSEVKGRKLKTVVDMFNKLSIDREGESLDCDDWVGLLKNRFWLTNTK